MRTRGEDDIFGLGKANVLDIQLIIQNNKISKGENYTSVHCCINGIHY